MGEISQLGFVVPDVDEAMRYWLEVLDVGPFFLQPRYQTSGITHRGADSPMEIAIALAYSGDMQIELIQQFNTAPSTYREYLQGKPEGGLHHVANFVDDYDSRLDEALERGLKVIGGRLSGDGVHFCYVEQPGMPGPAIELVDRAGVADVFSRMKKMAADWDGSAPIRPRPS